MDENENWDLDKHGSDENIWIWISMDENISYQFNVTMGNRGTTFPEFLNHLIAIQSITRLEDQRRLILLTSD